MLSRLKHPRVVSYNEVFLGSDPIKGNYVGIVMEYCAGGDLFQMLCKQRAKKNKPISQRRVKMWIVQLCEALAYLHSQEVRPTCGTYFFFKREFRFCPSAVGFILFNGKVVIMRVAVNVVETVSKMVGFRACLVLRQYLTIMALFTHGS